MPETPIAIVFIILLLINQAGLTITYTVHGKATTPALAVESDLIGCTRLLPAAIRAITEARCMKYMPALYGIRTTGTAQQVSEFLI